MGLRTDWPRAGREPGRPFEAAYLGLLRSGELARRARLAHKRLENCDLCARYCYVDRKQTIRGVVCRTGARAVVNSCGPHHGEEDPLRGSRGSGTIFFSWCNLRCVFCQNWEISWKGHGEEVEARELADMMLSLQKMGCHNINFVSPSHVVAQILEALVLAAEDGLTLPLVYNTGGYDSLEALSLLDGVVDIYMPDIKYGDSALGKTYSHVKDYVRINRAAIAEMHRQVGDLAMDANGAALRGLLVRHLVLPDDIAGTESAMRFLAEEISPNTYVNVMGQYRPCYRADEHPALAKRLSGAAYREALKLAKACGLKRFDHDSLVAAIHVFR